MAMRKTLEILNEMVSTGVIERYAIGGAVAAYNYIEPGLTEDLDILVSFETIPGSAKSGLTVLAPILSFLAQRGYTEFRDVGVVVEGWPVQFIPVANDLDAESLDQALDIDFAADPSERGVPTRVLRAEHIIATALKLGRPKDHMRMAAFVESQAYDSDALDDVLTRHGLKEKWIEVGNQWGWW